MPHLSIAAATCAALFAVHGVDARLGDGGRANVTLPTLPIPSAGTGIDVSTFKDDLAKAEATLLQTAFVRTGRGRKPEYWKNASLVAAASLGTASMYGHEYIATTTQYANTCCASCGAVDTAALVAGTDYYAVASAQAMQNLFHGEIGDCCWCGKAGPGCGHHTGTAPMGCTACAKGRFIRKLPYQAPMDLHEPLFHKEFNVVVADICPHQGNEAWCPPAAGHENTFGSKNHFDWASPPPGFDNYYFAFTPAPCSAEIQGRLSRMSQCGK